MPMKGWRHSKDNHQNEETSCHLTRSLTQIAKRQETREKL